MLCRNVTGHRHQRYSRGLLPRIALLIIIVMLLLYGALYLWAFWNPFGHVDKVPVALVNEDRPAKSRRQRGAAAIRWQRLIDSHELSLHEARQPRPPTAWRTASTHFTITIPGLQRGYRVAVRWQPRAGCPSIHLQRCEQLPGLIIGQNAARAVINDVNASGGADRHLRTERTHRRRCGADQGGRRSGSLADGPSGRKTGPPQLADGTRQLATRWTPPPHR